MSTIFASQRKDISGTGLTQTKSYNEGDAELLLDTITFDNENDYTDIITVTFDIAGLNQENFTLESTSEVAPIVVTDADTYTISSQYIKSGYTQNVWADVTSTLAGLKLTFNNSDASDDYVITATLSDGVNTVVGTITITGNAIIDAVNIVQNLNIDEDYRLWAFDPLFGYGDGNQLLPQIADLDEAGRTYRVTITSPAAAAILHCASVSAVGASTYEPIVVLEGTQTQINDAINGTEGILYVMTGPDNTDPFTITWLQEVIGGATGAPYVQENGQFNFTVTNVNAADTAVASYNYSEDVTSTPQIVATIYDTRTRATGLVDGNNYHATITLSNAASGSISPTTSVGYGNEWVDAVPGTGVYTLSLDNNPAGAGNMTTALNNVIFIPAADYNGTDDTMSLTLTRGHQKGDATWYISPNTNVQTLINGAVIALNRTASHDEFEVPKPLEVYEYDEDNDAYWNLGAITDKRSDIGGIDENIQYSLTITFSHVDAVDSLVGWSGVTPNFYFNNKTKAECNAELANVRMIPGADFIGDYTFTYQQQQITDGIDHGTSNAISVTRNLQHNEYTISTNNETIGEYSVTVLDLTNSTDIIIDEAEGKTYTITLTLSDVTKGTISAPWVDVTPGSGVYTLTNTREYLNTQLAAVSFDTTSLGDDVDTGTLTISYNQHQDTDNLAQGFVATIATLTFTGVVDALNITQSNIAILEDEYYFLFPTPPQIDDQKGPGSGKTYRVTMAPLAPADDVYIMWTNSAYVVGSAYSSTLVFEGTQTQINTALISNWHLDRPILDDRTDFTITWTQDILVGGVGTAVDYTQETGSFAFVVTPDVDDGMTVYNSPAYFNWNVDTASLLGTIAVITDTRGDYDSANIIYTAVLGLDIITPSSGTLSSAGSGGTVDWNISNGSALTITGTKVQVNSHLASITWTGLGGFSDAFTMNIVLHRDANDGNGSLPHKTGYNILMNSGNGAVGQNTAWRYDEDEVTLLNDATKLT